MRPLRAPTSTCALALAAALLSGCEQRADALSRQGGEAFAPAQGEALAAPGGTIDVAALVERLAPVVVSVTSSRTLDIPDAHVALGLGLPRVERAIGSGFVVSADGLVLTNDHVVADAYEIEVQLADERAFEGRVVGRDPRLDVALVKLRGAEGLPVAALGSSGAMRAGEPTIVIGNPYGLGHTVTMGIVSATSRTIGSGLFDGFLQTDAAINPGSSGGPVFDGAGRVVGIATAIHAQGRGIGFAIPIDEVRDVLPELRDSGHVARGRIGVTFQEITGDLARVLRLPGRAGALVTEVEPGSPAARVGIRAGDVITTFGGAAIGHARDLARALGRRKPGDELTVVYRREGADRAVQMKLDRMEDDAPLAPRGGSAARPRADERTAGVLAIDAPEGAQIELLDPRSPVAGVLEVGDVVMDLNGASVRGGSDLIARLRGAGAGTDLLLRVRRGTTILYLVARAQ